MGALEQPRGMGKGVLGRALTGAALLLGCSGVGGDGGGAASGGAASIGGGPTNGSGGTANGPGVGDDAAGGFSGGLSASGGSGSSGPFMPSFVLGADITITLEDEYWGATYTDVDGKGRALEVLLARHGFDFVRIGTFVEPGAPGGYAENMAEPFRDLAHTITLGKRVKDAGLGLLLDLHLSDTWTDPSAQAMPASFVGLDDEALSAAVHDYVFDAVVALRDAGATPDMVQVGNEITNGFLWPSGKIVSNDFSGFARLLKAGIAAVREVDPRIRVMLHIEKCNDLATSRWWLDGVLSGGVSFDVLGQSCYAPTRDSDGNVVIAGYQGEPSAWPNVFGTLASEYPELDFAIAEYSAEQRAANDVLRGLPEGRGLGSFNWDPTRSYATHPNVPLFSTAGAWNHYVAIPAEIGLYDQMASDYGLR